MGASTSNLSDNVKVGEDKKQNLPHALALLTISCACGILRWRGYPRFVALPLEITEP
jgi:hypothetical protein